MLEESNQENHTAQAIRAARNYGNPAKGWCFTWNNYPQDWNRFFENPEWLEGISYAIIGKEVGAQGTPHLQGYVYLKKKQRMSWFKRLLHNSIHLEQARGSLDDNKKYCSKEGNFIEQGTPPCTDPTKQHEEFVQACLTHTREEMLLHPKWSKMYLQKRDNYDHIRQVLSKKHLPRNGLRQVNKWYYGPAGTGKSYKAFTENPNAYIKGHEKWWGGYDGQEIAIIDDISPAAARNLTSYIKQWGDRYPFYAEGKGTESIIGPIILIITSNYSPDEIWAEYPVDLEAIRQRFKVEHFENPFNIPQTYLDDEDDNEIQELLE